MSTVALSGLFVRLVGTKYAESLIYFLNKNGKSQKSKTTLEIRKLDFCTSIAKFNVRTTVRLVKSYTLTGDDTIMKSAPYGELFAKLKLTVPGITEDTPEGRLILDSCNKVLVFRIKSWGEVIPSKVTVHEAFIEDKTTEYLYLRLSPSCVSRSRLKAGTNVLMEIQFRLNRIQFALWNYGLQGITDTSLLFPKLESTQNLVIPRITRHHFCCGLNQFQEQAVSVISAPLSMILPPVVIVGPYGSGKTLTLAESTISVLQQPGTRVLICTHSNSAADIYIKDYLHKFLNNGNADFRPLRIYHAGRKVTTVNDTVLKYCLTTRKDGNKYFKLPTMSDISRHRVVVTTLSSSIILSHHLNIRKGYFTHILIDEAAQAIEPEVLIPLSLATKKTRLAFAGDHMQLEPEIFSDSSNITQLDRSLLERLDSYYPENHPCKIILRDNYRSNKEIVEFTAMFFYPYQVSYQRLFDEYEKEKHSRKVYPLKFFTCRGSDKLDDLTLSYHNDAEVYETTARIFELRSFWPEEWGDFESNIGVLTPYGSQVFRIRSELRRVGLPNVSVERVRNVQGKQFRVVFLDTVRTRASCVKITGEPVTKKTYGFLSDIKLLNTAMSRAQSMICVIGDPLALVTTGVCRIIWYSFIEQCEHYKSCFGINTEQLKHIILNLDLKKPYVLNPQAKNFVPRSQGAKKSPPARDPIHVLHPLQQLSHQKPTGRAEPQRMIMSQPNCFVIPYNMVPNQLLQPPPLPPPPPQQIAYQTVYGVPMVPLMVPHYPPPPPVIPLVAHNEQMMPVAFAKQIILPQMVLSNSSPVGHRSNSSEHPPVSAKPVGAVKLDRSTVKRNKVEANNVVEEKNTGSTVQHKGQTAAQNKQMYSKDNEEKMKKVKGGNSPSTVKDAKDKPTAQEVQTTSKMEVDKEEDIEERMYSDIKASIDKLLA